MNKLKVFTHGIDLFRDNFIYFFIADEEKDENLCAYFDEDDCRFAYVYYYDENNKVMIRALNDRECPPKVMILTSPNLKKKLHFMFLIEFNYFRYLFWVLFLE